MRAPESDIFAELVERCLDAIESEGDGALDRICREHPEHAEELRRTLASLRRFGMLEAQPGGPLVDAGRAVGEAAIPDRLGEFRLLSRLGGGGMGVVYLAEQTSLQREVALKVVRPEQLFFPGARERFLREVAVIARLQHPGIVPVYTVGEEGGVPYYSMERVVGCTLANVVRTLSSRQVETLTEADLREAVASRTRSRAGEPAPAVVPAPVPAASWIDVCLRMVAQLADAVDHAHGRGVVHRDIKPSNVMVTPDGRVMLLDFGLASTDESSRITRSGSQVGSLPYMAPEQVRGEARSVDKRTDVYQLGITLYELLSLRLPYVDESGEAIRRLILEGVPPPLRALNRKVPWDVETVCLTAMERERERRYATAADFKRDLENLLARRPIAARRPGVLLRTKRFAQRRPAVAVGAALGLVILVGGPLAYAWFERDARRKVEEEKGFTEEQRVRAEAHHRRVLNAVSVLLEPLLDERTDEIPEMESVRRTVLERALAVYESFDAADEHDPELRHDVAKALVQSGEIYSALRLHTSAETSFENGVADLEALLAQKPGDPQLLLELGDALYQLAAVAIPQVESAGSETTFRRAIAAYESIPVSAPQTREAQRKVSITRARLASNLSEQLRIEEGEREARAAIAAAESAVALDPEDLFASELLARSYRALGDVLGFIPGGARRGEGIRAFDVARARYVELVAKSSGARKYRYALVQVLYRLGRAKDTLGRRDEGAEHASEALRIMDDLRARFPEVIVYTFEVGNLCSEMGYYRLAQGSIAEARAFLARACPLLREAARRDAGQHMRPVILATALARLADAERRHGDFTASIAAWDEAILEGGRPFNMKPAWIGPTVRGWRWDRVAVLIQAGELDDAAESIDELRGDDPRGSDEEARAAVLFARCADRAMTLEELPEEERLRKAEGFEDEAFSHIEKAIARGFKPSRAWFADPAVQRLTRRDDLRDRLADLGFVVSESGSSGTTADSPRD